MPFTPISFYRNNARFPTPPNKRIRLDAFPNDLIQSNRGYYTELTFLKYLPNIQIPGGINRGKPLVASGGIKLPLPKKINDSQTLSWQEISATQLGIAAAGNVPGGQTLSAAAQVLQPVLGVAINPFQFMTFKQPNYKEFSFTWTLTPNSPQESRTLDAIIYSLKQRSLPTFMGAYMEYPDILSIRMFPEQMGMRFKNCAIISVQVDYTGAGQPSFFRGTNAPTVVNITLNLKEIQLWDQLDYGPNPAGNIQLAQRAQTAGGEIIGGIRTQVNNAITEIGNLIR